MTTTEHFFKVVEAEPWCAGLQYDYLDDEIHGHGDCIGIRVVGDKIEVRRYRGRHIHERFELCDPESLAKLESMVYSARDFYQLNKRNKIT